MRPAVFPEIRSVRVDHVQRIVDIAVVAVLLQYERPADQSQEAMDKRAAYGQQFFQKYGASVYFRVRKTWADKASQLGAFRVLLYAKQCADKNPGYAVFNESGIQIYPSEKA